MAKSMTGYGICELSDENKKITIEMKSVNNRFADVNIRLRSAYIFLEEDIRKHVLKSVSRGKIDIFVTIWEYKSDLAEVKVDEGLAVQYAEAIKKVSEVTGLSTNASAEQIARFPDVLCISQKECDTDALKSEVLGVLDGTVKDFIKSREREGERIVLSLKECLKNIEKSVLEIEVYAPKIVEDYRLRLSNKLSELLENTAVDESRILTEAAIFADKVCTDEEIVRLKSHIKEFENVLSLDVPIGKKLDFIIQEMNREINTIGSKSNDIEIAKIVVNVKGEIEKLREQIQNIE